MITTTNLRSWSVAAALVVTLLGAVTYGTWLDWDWKAMTGWQPLVDYIDREVQLAGRIPYKFTEEPTSKEPASEEPTSEKTCSRHLGERLGAHQ